MNEIIQNKINSKNFTFMELLNMKELARSLAEETYEEISVTDQVRCAWEVTVTANGQAFGTIFRNIVVEALTMQFSAALKKMAEGATVSFGDNRRPPSPLPPPPPTPIKNPEEKTTTFDMPTEFGDDGVGLPKGVKRVH